MRKTVKGPTSAAAATTGSDEQAGGADEKLTGYEASFHQFIKKNWPGQFPKWQPFDDCKVMYRKMVKAELWMANKTYVHANARFTDMSMDKFAVLRINYKIFKLFDPFPEYRHNIMMLTLRFAVPSRDNTPWLITKLPDCKKVETLFEEMRESRLFKLSQKASDQTTAKTLASLSSAASMAAADAAEASEPKPGRKAKMQRVAKGSPGKQKDLEAIPAEKEGRPYVFVDDMTQAVSVALQGVESVNSEHVAHTFMWAIQLCLAGSIEISFPGGGKPEQFQVWVPLRKRLQRYLREVHGAPADQPAPESTRGPAHSGNNDGAEPGELASQEDEALEARQQYI